ncbi:MAG: porin [Gammaproteobacteria bacterium]|nr:porin [Gammaproteobacteria bacterium]MCF6229292.1 porin [Gammaproteobacteria bacterium]
MMYNILPSFSARHVVAPLIIAATLLSASPVEAKRFKYSNDGFEAWARLALSSQVSALDTNMTARDSSNWNGDASLRLNLRWISDNALTYGLRVEYDSNTHTAEDLKRDEIYAYMVGSFGRVEIGEQDGPADRLAFHAPITALGQIRGDFSRYVGSQALLSAYDTSDAAKLIFLSAPMRGWRYGLSYAPEYTRNQDAIDPRDRTRQRNAMEFGVQYQQDIGEWVGGVSGGYVTGDADASTQRADLDSWSVGGELRRGRFTLGTAYVWRGDSNLRTANYDQEEINMGVSWRGRKWQGRKWRAAFSAASVTSSGRDYDLLGVGMSMEVIRNLHWRADLVQYNETSLLTGKQRATVFITELELRI